METRSSQSSRPSRWERRPHLARLVRMLVLITPVVASSTTVLVLSRVVHRPAPLGAALAWWAGLLLVSTGVLLGTERIARRLLPLAALLRLSLAFPDAAPSRFGVLLRAGNSRRIERADGEPAEGRDGRARDDGRASDDARARDNGGRVPELLARRRPGATTPAEATPAEATAELARLVALLHSHDRRTRGHCERVRAYAVLIGQELRLSPEELDRLQWSALLHDIGKVTVPPELLNKPGALTDEEFLIVKGHPAAGAQLIEPLRWWLGEWADSVGQHHERYDGTGYPLRLAGTGISYSGRIVAVADAYDVMTAARSYKKPLDATVARTELTRCAGTHFDPVVVRAFLSVSIGRVQRASGPLGWLTNLPILGSAPLANAAVAAIQTIVPTITPSALSAAAAALVTAGTLAAAGPDPSPSNKGTESALVTTTTEFEPVPTNSQIEPSTSLAAEAPPTATSEPPTTTAFAAPQGGETEDEPTTTTTTS
ncbi:MAG: HD-GYP domain-containing protein, partial [Acidimicrobiia bacterium]